MPQHPIYAITSIGRPLDNSFATNRAVSRLMPVGAVIAVASALLRGETGFQLLGAVIAGAVLVFGVWALTRELAPDDNAAAFVSIGVAFLTISLLAPFSFLVLFTVMFLVRIINRSVGLPARITDSAVVTLLAWTVVYVAENPLFGGVAALAFALDAALDGPLRKQWVFAVLCFGSMLVSLLLSGIEVSTSWMANPGVVVALTAITVAYLATLVRTRMMHACGDVTGDRLSTSRVRAGMMICWLAALQGLFAGEAGLARTAVLWSAMAGVAATTVFVRVRKKSVS